jgi:fucose 4-O-acetylase-like acetyltransferase
MRSNKAILFLQFFGIFLVVLGHAYVDPERRYFIKDFLYNFHMPLFFTISGFLFMLKADKYSQSPGNFIKRKAQHLLIPYLFISILSYGIKAMFNQYSLRPVKISFMDFIHGLIYPWDNPNIFMWYISTLFIVFVVFILFAQVYKFRNPFLNVLILIGLAIVGVLYPPIDIRLVPATFLNYTGCLHYLVYFYLGMMFCYVKDKVPSFVLGKLCLSIICLISFGCLLWISIAKIPVMSMGRAVLGILFSWSLAVLVKNHLCKLIESIAFYSYQIYLLSWFVHQAVIISCWKILGINEYICCLIGIVLALGIPLLIAIAVQKWVSSPKIKMLIGL